MTTPIDPELSVHLSTGSSSSGPLHCVNTSCRSRIVHEVSHGPFKTLKKPVASGGSSSTSQCLKVEKGRSPKSRLLGPTTRFDTLLKGLNHKNLPFAPRKCFCYLLFLKTLISFVHNVEICFWDNSSPHRSCRTVGWKKCKMRMKELRLMRLLQKKLWDTYYSILRWSSTLWQSKRPPFFSPLGFRVSPLFFRRGLSSCNRVPNTFTSHQLASARDAPTRFGPVAFLDHCWELLGCLEDHVT